MLISPRSYQTEAIGSIWNYFYEGNTGNPVVAMPTGTGKSIVIAGFLESIYKQYPQQKVLVLTHVKELIAQNYDKLLKLWPQAPAGIYSAGLNRRDHLHKIIFGGIGSVAKKPHLFGHVDLILVDECHTISPTDTTMYRAFIAALQVINPHLKVIGFTATPWRLGFGKITEEGGIFTDICFDITTVQAFNRLIAEGYLAPLIPKPTRTKLDVDGVHTRGGEFIASELQSAVDKQEITLAAIKEAMEYLGQRKKWLVFCAGVDHVKHTVEVMDMLGIPARGVYSGMGEKDRDDALKALKDGTITALVNNNILTTGYDQPDIDLIIVLRPTQSAVLWVQMLGRGTRPAPGKENCLVLDFAANTKRLGPINDPVSPRKKGSKGGDAPVKLCPQCNTYQHASVRYCTGVYPSGNACTYEFVFETKLKAGASTDELIKGDLPVVEIFKVDHVTYQIHQKEGKPPSMRVTYYCGYRNFNDFVCVDYPDFAGRKARTWMRERLDGIDIPTTTAQALHMADFFKVPTHLRIWVNKKYPEIMAYSYDGTAFGTLETPSEHVPTIQKYDIPNRFGKVESTMTHTMLKEGGGVDFDAMRKRAFETVEDDDIPF